MTLWEVVGMHLVCLNLDWLIWFGTSKVIATVLSSTMLQSRIVGQNASQYLLILEFSYVHNICMLHYCETTFLSLFLSLQG